jgi:signal transduction histidine kinase
MRAMILARALPLLLALLTVSLLAFGGLADRALEGQAVRAQEAAAGRASATAQLTAASVRAAIAQLEQEVVAGRPPAEVAAERLAASPARSVPPAGVVPYGRRSRVQLAPLLRSMGTTPSGLPEAVVARLALGDAALSVAGGPPPPDVADLLLSGRLPVHPDDLPTLARALGRGGDPRVAALQDRLRRAPESSTLPFVPAFRRTRVDGRVQGWARHGGERVRYEVPVTRLLALAGVADRASAATAAAAEPAVLRVPVPDVEGLGIDVKVEAADALRLRALRAALWAAVAASILCLLAVRRALGAEARAMARERAFLGSVTHELRTPLTAIRLFGETLAEGRGEPREYGGLVAEESQRLERLVERVLAATRAGEAPSFARVEPSELVRSAVSLIAPRAERRSVTLALRSGSELPPATWDAEAVRGALLNLLDNAITHGRMGGHVEVRTQAEGDVVSVSVSDDGPGIGRRERKGLFRRFGRGASDGPGTGLGLHLVQEVARAHGGHVDLRSEEGRGCTFTLRLPSRPPALGAGAGP